MVDSTSLNKKFCLTILDLSEFQNPEDSNLERRKISKLKSSKEISFLYLLRKKKEKPFFWWFCYVELRLKTITDVVLGRSRGDNKQP